jgi:hypothetical protein
MQNWRVGPVQTVGGGSFWGSGFVLYDETGKPCTFGHAMRARDWIAAHACLINPVA